MRKEEQGMRKEEQGTKNKERGTTNNRTDVSAKRLYLIKNTSSITVLFVAQFVRRLMYFKNHHRI